jgi:hypothetical protein
VVELSLPAGAAVSVVPAGADVDDAVTTAPHRFAARAPRPGATGVDPEPTVFEWDRSPYADEYRLLVTRDGETVVDVTTRGTSHAAALAPGTDHEWTVEARNDRGSITADGAPLGFRTAYTAPPSQPARAAAYRTSETSVFVTWEAAENAATYTVERRAGDGAFTTIAAGVEGTSHTDAAAGGGPFEYRVTAVNDLGASEPSAAAAERPVDLSGGRQLSDLPWESATSGWRSVARDRAVGGGELRLGGTRFAKGLGTHANSEIVYPLGPGDDLFRAVVGIDDAKAGSPGSVVFRVLADGEVLYDSGVMRAQPYSPPREVLVDVSGRDRLLLQVLDAGDGNNSDHADWADAQLLEVGP